MQTINNKVILIVLLLFFVSPAYGYYRESFLGEGPSVAAFGRGETATSIFDDYSSVFYNPSLAAQLTAKTASLSYYPLFDGSMYSFAGFGLPLPHGFAGGISFINMRSGEVELRQNINDIPTTTNTNQWAGLISVAKSIEKPFALDVGLALRFIYMDLCGYKGSGMGVDAGLSRGFGGPDLFGNKSSIAVGLSAQNLVSPAVKLITESETYPIIYRLGASLRVPTVYHTLSYDELLITADIVSQDNITAPAAGAEYCFANRFIFKCGYTTDGTLTMGAGYKASSLRFDYAYDLGDLANFHRFGVSFFFGNRIKENNKYSLLNEAKRSLAEDKKRRKKAKEKLKEAIRYYKKGWLLKSTDLFKEVRIDFPEIETSEIYLNKISDEINAAIQTNESDIEKYSYADGYLDYQKLLYNDALNEWGKILQINPKNAEVIEYAEKIRNYLADAERIKQEKELEDKVKFLLDGGVNAFNSSKWISCIKLMEQVKQICVSSKFPQALEYSNTASDYINKAVARLSETVKPSLSKGKEETPSESLVDEEGAEKNYQEGLVSYAQGKLFDAEKSWELALRLNPGHLKAQKALSKLRETK